MCAYRHAARQYHSSAVVNSAHLKLQLKQLQIHRDTRKEMKEKQGTAEGKKKKQTKQRKTGSMFFLAAEQRMHVESETARLHRKHTKNQLHLFDRRITLTMKEAGGNDITSGTQKSPSQPSAGRCGRINPRLINSQRNV